MVPITPSPSAGVSTRSPRLPLLIVGTRSSRTVTSVRTQTSRGSGVHSRGSHRLPTWLWRSSGISKNSYQGPTLTLPTPNIASENDSTGRRSPSTATIASPCVPSADTIVVALVPSTSTLTIPDPQAIVGPRFTPPVESGTHSDGVPNIPTGSGSASRASILGVEAIATT